MWRRPSPTAPATIRYKRRPATTSCSPGRSDTRHATATAPMCSLASGVDTTGVNPNLIAATTTIVGQMQDTIPGAGLEPARRTDHFAAARERR